MLLQVRLGENDFTTSGEGSLKEITIDVANFYQHERFNDTPAARTPGYDIAVIELAQEVDLTTYTPACMAKTSDTTTFDGKNAWIYGENTKRATYPETCTPVTWSIRLSVPN